MSRQSYPLLDFIILIIFGEEKELEIQVSRFVPMVFCNTHNCFFLDCVWRINYKIIKLTCFEASLIRGSSRQVNLCSLYI